MPVDWKVYRSWVNTNDLERVTIKPTCFLYSNITVTAEQAQTKPFDDLIFRLPQIQNTVFLRL